MQYGEAGQGMMFDLHAIAIASIEWGRPPGAGLGKLSSPHQLQQAETLTVRSTKLLAILALQQGATQHAEVACPDALRPKACLACKDIHMASASILCV